MKPIRDCFLLLLLLAASTAQADDGIHVVVYGDSLTAGYQLQPEEAFPARLQRKIEQAGYSGVTVINLSQTGETSSGAAQHFNNVLSCQPDVVILELGVNDAMRGVDPRLIFRNLWTMASTLKEKGVYVIIAGFKAPPGVNTTYAERLTNIFHGLEPVAKIYPDILQDISGHSELSLADGLHPNARGVDVMVNKIFPLVDAGLRWKIQVKQSTPVHPPLVTIPAPPAADGVR